MQQPDGPPGDPYLPSRGPAALPAAAVHPHPYPLLLLRYRLRSSRSARRAYLCMAFGVTAQEFGPTGSTCDVAESSAGHDVGLSCPETRTRAFLALCRCDDPHAHLAEFCRRPHAAVYDAAGPLCGELGRCCTGPPLVHTKLRRCARQRGADHLGTRCIPDTGGAGDWDIHDPESVCLSFCHNGIAASTEVEMRERHDPGPPAIGALWPYAKRDERVRPRAGRTRSRRSHCRPPAW
jgi:hypothetical protein